MIKHYLNKPIYSLLLVLTFLTACNEQTKTQPLVDGKTEPKAISKGQPKLVKTQGSTESDNVWCSLQDKKGNLWFGTRNTGLYKFDGKNFTNFSE